MTGPVNFPRPGESLQRTQTSYRRFVDNHGRVFEAQCDTRNGHPKEELRPINDNPKTAYMPPWLPPMRFAKFLGEHRSEFRWDYNTMATELAGDAADYYQRAKEFAIEHDKPEPELGGPVDASIRFLIGKPPLSPIIPLACEQGEPWILGVPGAAVNAVLKDILEQGVTSNSKAALDVMRSALMRTLAHEKIALVPTVVVQEEVAVKRPKTIHDIPDLDALPEITYLDFLKECRGKRMKMPDIVKLWNSHKAATAENATAGA